MQYYNFVLYNNSYQIKNMNIEKKHMYIALSAVAVGLVTYLAVTDIFDFSARGKEEDE